MAVDSGKIESTVIVKFARAFGWKIDDIRQLTNSEAYAIMEELAYQESADDYKENYRAAFIVASVGAMFGGKQTAKDIAGNPPKRDSERAQTLQLAMSAAERKGVNLPK